MDPTKDKVEGKADQASGKLKEMAGRTFNDPDLEAEGKTEKGKGKLQEAVGDVKQAADKARKGIKDAI